MSRTIFLNQPFEGQLGHTLVELLQSGGYSQFHAAVAFARISGVLRMKNAMDSFVKRGGSVSVIVGIDLGGTSYEALIALYGIVTDLYIAHVKSAQIFHPKLYAFYGEHETTLIVGSQNLTGAGLWTNIETCSITKIERASEDGATAVAQFDNYFDSLSRGPQAPAVRVESKKMIEDLLLAGFIEKEMSTHLRQARSVGEATHDETPCLSKDAEFHFVSSIPAQIPPVHGKASLSGDYSFTALDSGKQIEAIARTETSINVEQPVSSQYQVFWFETRSLTGGSRNILDLSMRARLEKGSATGTEYDLGDPLFMGGGVLFFGINPESEVDVDIVINYNGVDYFGNTIKLPIGDNANGSWRLQIKGRAQDGAKIIDCFERGGLVGKILAFERIRPDYFALTIFPGTSLDEFREASSIVARNGVLQTAKLFGLL